MEALFDVEWIRSRLTTTTIADVCDVYERSASGDAAGILLSALRLSASVLQGHKDQLRTQLSGRLAGVDHPEIVRLLEQVASCEDTPWLKPVLSTMWTPNGVLFCTLPSADQSARGFLAIDDAGTRILLEQGSQIQALDIRRGTTRTMVYDAATALSADGSLLLTGSRSGDVGLRSITRADDPDTLGHHGSSIDAVALSPDGHLAVAASSTSFVDPDGWSPPEPGTLTVSVWDTMRRCLVRRFTEPFGALRQVAVSQDRDKIVALSAQGQVLVLDVPGGNVARSEDCRTLGIEVIALSPDARWLISTPFDNVLRVWDLETLSPVGGMLEAHTRKIEGATVSHDGEWLVSVDRFTVLVWHIVTRTVAMALSRRASYSWDPFAMAISASGDWMVTRSDHQMQVWRNPKIARPMDKASCQTGDDFGVAVDPTERWMVTITSDSIRLWDLQVTNVIATHQNDEGFISIIDVESEGGWALLEQRDGTRVRYDVEHGRLDETKESFATDAPGLSAGNLPTAEPVDDVSRFGERIASSSNGERILRWVWDDKDATYERPSTGERQTLSREGHSSWGISPDGQLAVSWGSSVTVWNLDTCEPLATFVGDSEIVKCMILGRSRRIVVCERVGHVHVLELMMPAK